MNTLRGAVSLMVCFFAVSMLVFQVQNAGAQSADAMEATFEKSTEIWNTGKLELVDEVYTANAIRHGADGQTITGAEALKTYIGNIRTIYPDFKVVVNNQIGDNDMVANHWTVTATNKGALSETMPATGKSVEISGVTIVRFVDGKIAEERAYWNHGGEGSVLAQLGFTLTPPMMAEKE